MMTAAQLKEMLEKELHNDAALQFLNTRLILRTGFGLTETGRAHTQEALCLILKELQAMGYLQGVRA